MSDFEIERVECIKYSVAGLIFDSEAEAMDWIVHQKRTDVVDKIHDVLDMVKHSKGYMMGELSRGTIYLFLESWSEIQAILASSGYSTTSDSAIKNTETCSSNT
jgi:hypothetical protein